MLNISIWLIPQKYQKEKLQKIINTLANKYHSFPFLPHITAYYLDTSMKLDKVKAVLQQVVKEAKPITLDLVDVSYSEQFTNTLFARYKISFALQALYDNLRLQFYSTFPYELNPHLSLIYKNNMSEKDKRKEIQQLNIPQQLTLDRIMIITKKGSSIAQEKDVLDWKVSLEIPFR